MRSALHRSASALGLAIAPAASADQAKDGHAGMNHAAMAEGVHTEGEIHSIEGDTVNLTHEPIPDIGWPAMTMDLKLLEDADIGEVQPGDRATIMLEKGPDGLYGIRSLTQAE